MELSLLNDDTNAENTVTQWYFDQWCGDGSYTLAQVSALVKNSANRTSPPLTVLAKQDQQLVGAAQLKIREMADYPQYEFWLGGVYVCEQGRGQGVAAQMVDEIIVQAKRLGITALYLQTQDLCGGLYADRGFIAIKQTQSNGHQVLIMTMKLSSKEK